MYSFSKLHSKSVCTPIETVSMFCRSNVDIDGTGCGDDGVVGDVGGFVAGDVDNNGAIIDDESFLIDCCCVGVVVVVVVVVDIGLLLLRRFTSTIIGSDAFRNSLTASSCAKLLTSLPFTCKYSKEKIHD